MFDRFTKKAREIMQMANQEAIRVNYEYIGTEHILLGLLATDSEKCKEVLKSLNLEPQIIRLEIERRLADVPPSPINTQLPQTPRAKNVIKHAIEEMQNLNQTHVETAHILLGLLREDGGVAAEVLMDLGLKFENVRDEVKRFANVEEY